MLSYDESGWSLVCVRVYRCIRSYARTHGYWTMQYGNIYNSNMSYFSNFKISVKWSDFFPTKNAIIKKLIFFQTLALRCT